MRRAAIIAGIGWAAIAALAWWLADTRIALCHKPADYSDMTDNALVSCIVKATAARDGVLIWGATGLLAIIVAATAGRAWSASSPWPAKGAQGAQPKQGAPRLP